MFSLPVPGRYTTAERRNRDWLSQRRIGNGEVGERLKPAVLKNKIADLLSNREIN
jgi:hypothetical protein